MRIGGWQRTGVILSIVWALGAPLFAWDVYTENGAQRVETALTRCEFERLIGPLATTDSKDCAQKVQKLYVRAYRLMWVKLAVIALVPVALAWMGVMLSRRPSSPVARNASGTD